MLKPLNEKCLRAISEDWADADRRGLVPAYDDPIRQDADQLVERDRYGLTMFREGARYERSHRADRHPTELPLKVFTKTERPDHDDDDGLDFRALAIMAIVTVAFLLCGSWVYQRSVRAESRANAQLAQIQRERGK